MLAAMSHFEKTNNLRCPCEYQLYRPRSRHPGEYEKVRYCGNHHNDDPNQRRIEDVTNDDWHQQEERYQ